MATKRTKIEEPAPAAKPAPKRKVAVRPGLSRAKTPEPIVAVAPVKAAAAPKKAKPAPAPAKTVGVIPTEVIALRAYFIAEARRATGQPGNETTDWLEAESQLRSESGA